MSFNNSYGEEPGKGRASWAVPGAATALPALPQAALRTPPARSCGRRVRAGQDGGEVGAGWGGTLARPRACSSRLETGGLHP